MTAAALLDALVILDVEASGLGELSWPIEVEVAVVEGDAVARSGSRLIRPDPSWDAAGRSEDSAAVHRIPRAALDGAPAPAEVARWLIDLVDARPSLSDVPLYDRAWLSSLLAAANVGRNPIRLRDCDRALIKAFGTDEAGAGGDPGRLGPSRGGAHPAPGRGRCPAPCGCVPCRAAGDRQIRTRDGAGEDGEKPKPWPPPLGGSAGTKAPPLSNAEGGTRGPDPAPRTPSFSVFEPAPLGALQPSHPEAALEDGLTPRHAAGITTSGCGAALSVCTSRRVLRS